MSSSQEELKPKFYGAETLNGLPTKELEEIIGNTFTPEVLAGIETVEFIDEKDAGGKGVRGETGMGALTGRAKIRIYRHNLDYRGNDNEGKSYELEVTAFHEIGHNVWRSLMLPSRLKPQETPKGVEAQIIGSKDREEWFKLFMTKRGNKYLGWIDEGLFKEGTPYEFSEKLEEGWSHVFAQVAISPELLDKDDELKQLMGKYIK